MLRESRPNLIVLDILLRGSNGLALLDYLFDRPIFATLPVICFSGCDDDDVMAEARLLGADGFVVKSADYDRCLTALEAALLPWLRPSPVR